MSATGSEPNETNDGGNEKQLALDGRVLYDPDDPVNLSRNHRSWRCVVCGVRSTPEDRVAGWPRKCGKHLNTPTDPLK
jgi:hypothetical protein